MNEKELLESRIKELDKVSYSRDILRATGFLSLSEQSVFHGLSQDFLNRDNFLCGGHEDADRRVGIFMPSYYSREGAEEELISCIRVRPVNERFADELSHRDFLGALMNLGIERDRIGDILTDGKKAYIFCLAEIADYICSSISSVKHTTVILEKTAPGECDIEPAYEECRVNTASDRADGVVAALYKLSRSQAQTLFSQEKVFADGRVVTDCSDRLKEGARISVRGFGKFIYEGIDGTSRKGRLYVKVRRFV